MRRLGLWARANPFKVFSMFLALILLGFTVEQEVGGIGGFFGYFILMFSAIALGVAYLRGGK